MTGTRPWKRAAAWLLFLGPFFFASYGLANWLAGRRADVGSIVFDWERSIPFMPWTIVPYWSIDFLYVVSLFVCATRREVDRHAQRLLMVQLISVLFFIAFPLRFAFERPASHGLFGAMFTALTSFDKPFNQAPSLHIALLVVIWARLAAHTSRRWLWILHIWMLLIGVSILTTWQHHFIDLPTGAAVGLFVMWALPEEEGSPLAGLSYTRDRKRRRLALLYLAGSCACIALSMFGGTWLWMTWAAGALALVAFNYAFAGARGFQKRPNGQLSAGARFLLAPYTLFAWINSRLWTFRHPSSAEVADGVFIGRIPGPRERHAFAAVVDLCAELSCFTRTTLHYSNVRVLDLTVPTEAELRNAARAIETARAHGPVLVCCALGFSRSAAAVVAWLLTTNRAQTVEGAKEIVRKARPSIVLRSEYSVVLEEFA